MKRQTKRRIMALVMAALMVVGLIPTGFAAKAVSAANNVYTFDASAETAITTAEKKAEAGRTAVRRILQSQPDHWHGTSIFLQK